MDTSAAAPKTDTTTNPLQEGVVGAIKKCFDPEIPVNIWELRVIEQMKGRRIGNWELQDRLGSGGMGEVHLARHVQLGTPAAVKALAPGLTSVPGFRERFFREARTMALLRHPHIAQVIDYTE